MIFPNSKTFQLNFVIFTSKFNKRTADFWVYKTTFLLFKIIYQCNLEMCVNFQIYWLLRQTFGIILGYFYVKIKSSASTLKIANHVLELSYLLVKHYDTFRILYKKYELNVQTLLPEDDLIKSKCTLGK